MNFDIQMNPFRCLPIFVNNIKILITLGLFGIVCVFSFQGTYLTDIYQPYKSGKCFLNLYRR